MRITASAVLVVLVFSLMSCSSCPPGWVAQVPQDDRFVYAAGTSGELLGPDEWRVALTRATRALAGRLDIDVSGGIVVTEHEARVWVDAKGAAGVHDDFPDVEVVERSQCDGVTSVLVRSPRPEDDER